MVPWIGGRSSSWAVPVWRRGARRQLDMQRRALSAIKIRSTILFRSTRSSAPDWVKSLFARGDRTWYAGDDLKTIGMPVGGLCAGQVYLTGDGRLVYWGIFNQRINSGYGRLNYKVGREPTEMVIDNKQVGPSPAIDQGFSMQVVSEAGTQVRSLDSAGFPQARFCGEYPIGYVEYEADDFPLQVQLEAFSPFIPLNTEDSALPASILNFTLKNTSSDTGRSHAGRMAAERIACTIVRPSASGLIVA